MMNEENKRLAKEINARNNAMIIINKYTSGKIPKGKYAKEIIEETYINLASQLSLGQMLCVEGQVLDVKIGKPYPIANLKKYINGYKIGKFAINYYQKTNSSICDYDENERIIITTGSLIEDKLNNSSSIIGDVIYDGSFKDINTDGLSVLELCMKFSALSVDMFLNRDLLQLFSENIKQSNRSINELVLLNDKKI